MFLVYSDEPLFLCKAQATAEYYVGELKKMNALAHSTYDNEVHEIVSDYSKKIDTSIFRISQSSYVNWKMESVFKIFKSAETIKNLEQKYIKEYQDRVKFNTNLEIEKDLEIKQAAEKSLKQCETLIDKKVIAYFDIDLPLEFRWKKLDIMEYLNFK